MKHVLVKIALSTVAALVVVIGALALLTHSQAHASGTQISTSTTTKTMISAKCYRTNQRTVTTYHHASGKGWERYAAPRVTTSASTTCYPR